MSLYDLTEQDPEADWRVVAGLLQAVIAVGTVT
jgi:hypothetical protein